MEILKSRPEILTLIEDTAHEQDFKNFKITDVKTNDKGEGFLSKIYLISVKDEDTARKLDVVIKASLNEEKNKSSVSIMKTGMNEVYFYSKVCEIFKKIQEKKGIKDEIEYIPKCYKTVCDSQLQLLCLENLRVQNFEVIDKRANLDHDHVSLVFKSYGRLHAYSYALRDQEPETFESLYNGLYNLYLDFLEDKNTGFAKNVEQFFNLAYKYLVPGEDDIIIERAKKYLGQGSIQTLSEIVTEKNNPYFVITHGDCWSNNMMFKYTENENRRKVTNVKLLDFQLSKLGSPVCDLSYFLYSGSSKEIFDNLKYYLKMYHESFSSHLRKLGSDPEKLFPFSELEKQWKKYAMHGVFMATMILKMKVTEKEEIKDLTDDIDNDELTDAFLNSAFDENVYQKKIRDLFLHLLEIGVL